MTDQQVNLPVLREAAILWIEQAQAVTSAAQAVSGAPTSGFDPDVSADVASFLSTWSITTQEIADRTQNTSEELDGAWAAYITMDYGAQQEFERLYGYTS